jgi:hypothetical protein
MKFIGIQHTDNMCWISYCNTIIGDIFCHHRACPHDCIPSNTYAWQNDGMCAYPGSFFDQYRSARKDSSIIGVMIVRNILMFVHPAIPVSEESSWLQQKASKTKPHQLLTRMVSGSRIKSAPPLEGVIQAAITLVCNGLNAWIQKSN